MLDMEKHHRERSAIEFRPDEKWSDSDYDLYVTHNGWQWQAIGFTVGELTILANKLAALLEDVSNSFTSEIMEKEAGDE